MAARSKDIRCRSCSRVLLTVSAVGLEPREAAHIQGCDTCQQFGALYDTLQIADREWEEAMPKRDTNRGKMMARDKHKKAHMDFDNWLMGVEEPLLPSDSEIEPHGTRRALGRPTFDEPVEEQQQGKRKRARSHSPTTSQLQNPGTSEVDVGSRSHQQNERALSLRPSPKRSISTTSLPERKRLKFSDSVEFREDYRDSSGYQRSGDTYVRGRYAPDEGSEYLDTSGSGQSFLKFTRMKRVKDKWVEIDEKEAEKGNKYTGELRKLGVSAGIPAQESEVDSSDELAPIADTPQDARAQRLTRRSRRTLGADPDPSNDSAEFESDNSAYGGRSTYGSSEGKQTGSNDVGSPPLSMQVESQAEEVVEPVADNEEAERSDDRGFNQEATTNEPSKASKLVDGGTDREADEDLARLDGEDQDMTSRQATCGARMEGANMASKDAHVDLTSGVQSNPTQIDNVEPITDTKAPNLSPDHAK
jgi:hypothetical protein